MPRNLLKTESEKLSNQLTWRKQTDKTQFQGSKSRLARNMQVLFLQEL